MPTDTTPTPPSITESDLAKALGIDRNVLREQRIIHLQPDLHWFQKKSAVHLNAEGVCELCERLDLPVPEGWAEAPEKKDAPENPWTTAAHSSAKKDGAEDPPKPPPLSKKQQAGELAEGVRRVFISRRAQRNPRVVFARAKDQDGVFTGPEYSVRVRDAFALGIGDELHVKTDKTLAWLFGPQPRPQRRRPAPRPAPSTTAKA